MARMRPEAAHAPGACRLAGFPRVGPLLALAHAREVDARAAQTTTEAGRTVRKTTAARALVSWARYSSCPRCWTTAAAHTSESRSAASGARSAGRRSIHPSTDRLGSHRHTATGSWGGAAAAAAAPADEAVRNTVQGRRTGRTAAARSAASVRAG